MKFKTKNGGLASRMSLRDHFAGEALKGMLASTPIVDRTKVSKTIWASIAYAWADAMVAERRR